MRTLGLFKFNYMYWSKKKKKTKEQEILRFIWKMELYRYLPSANSLCTWLEPGSSYGSPMWLQGAQGLETSPAALPGAFAGFQLARTWDSGVTSGSWNLLGLNATCRKDFLNFPDCTLFFPASKLDIALYSSREKDVVAQIQRWRSSFFTLESFCVLKDFDGDFSYSFFF